MPSYLTRSWRVAVSAALLSAGLSSSALAAETVVDRSAFSTTVEAGDAFKTRTYPEPVNFEQSDGGWAAIDRTLVREADGSVHPVAVDGDTTIPTSLTRPVVLEHDGRTISFRLLGADAEADRDVSGTKASFDDALGGVDVSYKVRHNGLKETIKLESRTSRRSFSYDVRTDADLTAVISGGDLVFSDAAGEEQFRVAAPLAWDSAELAETANALTLSVAKIADRQWRLTMRADDKWLDDSARVFPVTLDPDYYWIDGYMRFHGASQDCAMAGGTLAGQSRCAYTALQVGYGNNRPYKSVMKFDINAAIPAYATATASRFLAWQFPSSAKFNVSSRLRTVTTDWNNTATWDVSKTGTRWLNGGGGGDVSTDPNLTGPPTIIAESGYWSYWTAPLASVNGWIKGTLPNYGFQLSTDLTGPTDVKSAYEFTSTDGAQESWPALEVTWVPDTVAPPAPIDLFLETYEPNAVVPVAAFAWNPLADPPLSNGTPGSGIVSLQARYAVNGGTFTAWAAVNEPRTTISGIGPGTVVTVETRSIDQAGNVSASKALTATLSEAVVDGVADRGDVGDSSVDPGGPVNNNPANDGAVGTGAPDPPDPVATLNPVSQPAGFAAAAADVSRRWTIGTSGGWVTARNDRQQLVIGSARNGWTFDSIKASGNGTGLWGYLFGQYKYCGWINSNSLDSEGDNPNDRCGSADYIPVRRFAGRINCDKCDGGTNAKLVSDATAFRNVRPWKTGPDSANPGNYTLSGPTMYYKAGERVRWRYVTLDNKWVLVVDGDIPSGDKWAFIPRGAFGFMDEGTEGMCRASGRKADQPSLRPERHTDWPRVCTINDYEGNP